MENDLVRNKLLKNNSMKNKLLKIIRRIVEKMYYRKSFNSMNKKTSAPVSFVSTIMPVLIHASIILFMITCTLSFTACGLGESASKNSNENNGSEKDITDASCLELAMGMTGDKEYDVALVTYEDENFDNVMNALYGLDMDIKDGAIIYSISSRSYEWAVIEVSEKNSKNAPATQNTTNPNDNSTKEETEIVMKAFEARKEQRESAYYGYFPEEADMIGNGLVYTRGNYVVLAICDDADEARKSFCDVFEMNDDELKKFDDEKEDAIQRYREVARSSDKNSQTGNSQSGETDSGNSQNDGNQSGSSTGFPYDEKPVDSEDELVDIDDSIYYNQDIVRAVKARDMSILTEPKDQAIYKAAVAVIDSVITEDMTDVEKEKAVHDYLCINMDYDIPAVDDESKADPDADNPYGMLVGHYGICSGYASTFKLFMDCFDIECIIVEGKANGLEEDHAWNKIHIDGKWYNVDVTWDDPVYYDEQGNVVTESWDENYQFFNCPDNVLEATEHYWNHDLYPESDD